MKFLFNTDNGLKNADFLVKSSFGISLIAFLIVLPFTIIAFVGGRLFTGTVCFTVLILCCVSAYWCYRGRYLLWLNLFAIVPSISIANLYTFYTVGVAGAFWTYMVVFTMYFVLPPRYAKISNAIFLCVAITIASKVLEPQVFMRFSAALVGSSFFILVAVREIFRQQDQLKNQAATDSLTGLLNRTLLQESLQRSIDLSRQKQQPSCVCLLDIDHFKKINDTYGHDVGDQVIVKLADTVKSVMSGRDTLYRIGGEEFLIVMDNTNYEEGYATALALVATIESTALIAQQIVTISAGISEVAGDKTWKSIIKEADENLYKAKESGRNRVVGA